MNKPLFVGLLLASPFGAKSGVAQPVAPPLKPIISASEIIAKDGNIFENPTKFPQGALSPPTAKNAYMFMGLLNIVRGLEGDSSDADQIKVVENHGKIASLYSYSLAGAGNKVETALPPITEIIRRSSLGINLPNDQIQLISLTALQNARVIEQNDKIIALLQTLAAKK
jgi:hypothetical protein